jgi:H+/Cl- antiporter ClcA
MNDQLLKIRIWTKAIVLILLTALVLTLLLLNANAVIEPRLHLLFIQFERPNLLLVLLATSFLGMMGGFMARAIARTLRELREARLRSQSAGREREDAQRKRPAPPETSPGTAP